MSKKNKKGNRQPLAKKLNPALAKSKPTGKYSSTVAHAMCTEIMDQLIDDKNSGMMLVSGTLGARAQSYGTGANVAIVSSFASLVMNDPGFGQFFDGLVKEVEARRKQAEIPEAELEEE